jgi:2-C-methyl-D-erythritol 4-phosphate cytidylyltransferase
VLVHDGARPLVTVEIIERVIEAAERVGAALAALPVYETLKEVDSGEMVIGTLDRKRYFRAQTPQGFRYGLLKSAFEKARSEGFVGTDEASLVERLGVEIRIVSGSERNIKVTTLDDLALAEWYLRIERRPVPDR